MKFVEWYISKVPNHFGKMSALRLIWGERFRVRLQSKYDVEMEGEWADATFRSAIIGKYDDVYSVVNELGLGMAFVDIGANAGVFSLIASRKVGLSGVVVSFEPSASNFRNLVTNLAIGDCENVFPFRCAIDSCLRMNGFVQGPLTHSGVSRVNEESETKVLAIGGAVLNDLLATLLASRATVVKIDVEGAEMSVLKGLGRSFLSSEFVRSVVVEIDQQLLRDFGSNSSEIYAFMAESGFVATIDSQANAHYNEIFVKPSVQ